MTADAGWAAQDQIVVRVDPLAIGELMEQRPIEAARGAVIDVLDDGVVTQPGIAQAGGEALVAAMGDLAIDEETEPIDMGEGCAFAGGFELGEGLGHAGKPEFGELIEHRMGQHFHSPNQLMVVAGSTNVGVEDRAGVGGPALRGLAIELVVEDRAHRAVGQGADLDGARGRRFKAIGAERPDQAHDAEAGAEALFGMWPTLQDQLAQGRRGRTDRGGLAADAIEGPVGISPMARRHVIGDGGMAVIAAGAQMRGDPLALEEDLDGTRRQPHLDLAASEAVGHAVEVSLDLDVVIDADPPQPPFGEGVGLVWQALQVRPIEFLE